MSRFFGVLRHEFNISMRRPGMWIAYGLVLLFYSITVMYPVPEEKALILVGRALAAEGFDESWLYAPDYVRRFRPQSARASGHTAALRGD